jgi:hypothetical protein
MGARIIRNLSWLITTAIFVAGSPAKGDERMLFLGGHGAIPCQECSDLREAKQKNENIGTSKALLIFSLENWALGFISGVSAGTEPGAREVEETILCETNDADVLERIDSFCKANPTFFVFQAALHVSGDLVSVNAQRIRRALEMYREGIRSGPHFWANPPR